MTKASLLRVLAALCLLTSAICHPAFGQEPPYNTPGGNAAPPATMMQFDVTRQKATPATTDISTYSAVWPFRSMVGTVTDMACITGSATKLVTVTKFAIHTVGVTSGGVLPVVVLRTTANSGGTTTTAPAAVPHDQNDAAATAGLIAYSGSGNPTSGAGAPIQEAPYLTSASDVYWVFGTNNAQAIVLRGTAQSLCSNYQGSGSTSGASSFTEAEWTEQ